MPNHKSFKKTVIKNELKRKRNKGHKTKIKNLFKAVETVENNDKKTEMLKDGYKIIDKACAAHVLKKNKAARKKSQLAKILS